MFYQKQTMRFLTLVLLASPLFNSSLATGVRAQAPANPPGASRSRPADDSPQQTPKPRPAPKENDEILPDDEVLKVETNLTNVLFTAADKQKRFVTTLRREDVRILEDGQPQEIFTFARQVDLPLSIAIMVDTSASEERTLPIEKDAAKAFIDAVIRPEKDEAAVVSFTGEATLEQGLTSSVARLRRALDRVEFVPPSGYIGNGQVIPGTPPISDQSLAGSTAIWDSIWITADEVLSNSSDKTRRVIILLTDGEDTSSHLKKLGDAIDRAVKTDVVIYAIGIGDQYMGGINEGVLRKVSERTGGRAFFPRSERDLQAAFAQIQLELRSQYLIAYSPTNKNRDGSYRHVQIEIANPELRKENVRLSYRQGYYAKTSAPTNTSLRRK